jgi:hypothetical protein
MILTQQLFQKGDTLTWICMSMKQTQIQVSVSLSFRHYVLGSDRARL